MSRHRQSEKGNALIYILIALALLGALTMLLSRQNERSSGESMTEDMLNFETTRMRSYAASAQDAVNKMIMSGSSVDDLQFFLPNVASYDTGSHIHKVFHPEGGGLNPGNIDPKIFTGTDTDPAPGWYMGRFNNVGWSGTPAQDVLLVAHQISQPLCAKINKDLTGSDVIPAIGGSGNLRDYLIDTTLHTGGANADFTSAICAGCDQKIALCVSNTAGDIWSFFTVIESR